MAYQFTNNASTTLASSLTAAATSLTVVSGGGSLFPVPNAADFFHATLADATGNLEIVRVTARSTDTFTIQRAQEGTTARVFAAGDRVELRITAAAINSLAAKDSPTFTGTPAAPTAAVNTNTTQVATTAFVVAQIADDAPTKTGVGATGTWSINITGSAVSSTTGAVKTADTSIATTAFVDRLRSLLGSTTTGTAVLSDRGCLVSLTAGFTIPASVFAANDTFTMFNNTAANLTITQGAGLTLHFAGTATTGNRTLAQRGLSTVVFISPTVAVISGAGLS